MVPRSWFSPLSSTMGEVASPGLMWLTIHPLPCNSLGVFLWLPLDSMGSTSATGVIGVLCVMRIRRGYGFPRKGETTPFIRKTEGFGGAGNLRPREAMVWHMAWVVMVPRQLL